MLYPQVATHINLYLFIQKKKNLLWGKKKWSTWSFSVFPIWRTKCHPQCSGPLKKMENVLKVYYFFQITSMLYNVDGYSWLYCKKRFFYMLICLWPFYTTNAGCILQPRNEAWQIVHKGTPPFSGREKEKGKNNVKHLIEEIPLLYS